MMTTKEMVKMSKIDDYIIKRSKKDPEFAKAVEQDRIALRVSAKLIEDCNNVAALAQRNGVHNNTGLTQREFAKSVHKSPKTI